MSNVVKQSPATPDLKAPESIPAYELVRQARKGTASALLDVREAAAYHSAHIPGSIHAPDSQTTALVKKLQTLDRAILICDTGKVSAMVRRTLGFCGFHSVSYLEGGLKAWVAAGGELVETTRSGGEKPLDLPDGPIAPRPAPSPWRRMVAALTHLA